MWGAAVSGGGVDKMLLGGERSLRGEDTFSFNSDCKKIGIIHSLEELGHGTRDLGELRVLRVFNFTIYIP